MSSTQYCSCGSILLEDDDANGLLVCPSCGALGKASQCLVEPELEFGISDNGSTMIVGSTPEQQWGYSHIEGLSFERRDMLRGKDERAKVIPIFGLLV